MERISLNINDIIKDIEGSDNPVGSDLSYTEIYDNIKNARFQEDDRLSFGVWERELKKADWNLVESISFDALCNKSKDLQIVAWLIEALVSNDGFLGIIQSAEILKLFLESFWYTCYPKNEDDSSDIDQKIRILNWISEVYGRNISFVKLTENGINLYDYEYALEIKSLMKRSAESSAEILNSLKKDNRLTLDEIYAEIKAEKQESLRNILNLIAKIKQSLDSLTKTLNKVLPSETVISFSSFLEKIEKINRFISSFVEKQSTPENTLGNTEEKSESNRDRYSVNSREDIYNNMKNLSAELREIDKHSPSPYVLELVVSWKDKSLLEIMTDLQSGDSEAHKLLKFLIKS